MDLDRNGGFSPPWAELTPDALREVARHLHDAADFVRFHAVCRKWRDASSATPTLHPWFIEPVGQFSSGLRFHMPFTKEKNKGLYLPHEPALRSRRFECSDAARGRLLAAGVFDDDRTASLVNPLTGDSVILSELPRDVARGCKWTNGFVSGNGSVLFEATAVGRLSAAVLRPGKTKWEHVDVAYPVGVHTRRDLFDLDDEDLFCAALCSSGVLAGGRCAMARLPPMLQQGERFVLESIHGELLCVDVLGLKPYQRQTTRAPAVAVHVHELELDDAGKPRWVARGRCNGGDEHVCLFLGYESSFAVDAREFSGSADVIGGCAYFVGRHPTWTEGKEVNAVYRYSFKDGMATVVDELPVEFGVMSMWFTPRPRISPLSSRPGPARPSSVVPLGPRSHRLRKFTSTDQAR